MRQKQPQHEPHEQVYSNGRTIQITERTTPDGGLVISYHDVTALRRASAEIENLAFYDPLTNLPNRRLLMDRMQQAIAASARSSKPTCRRRSRRGNLCCTTSRSSTWMAAWWAPRG